MALLLAWGGGILKYERFINEPRGCVLIEGSVPVEYFIYESTMSHLFLYSAPQSRFLVMSKAEHLSYRSCKSVGPDELDETSGRNSGTKLREGDTSEHRGNFGMKLRDTPHTKTK